VCGGLNNHKNINRLCICNEQDIYKYFNLTEEEINLIEIMNGQN